LCIRTYEGAEVLIHVFLTSGIAGDPFYTPDIWLSMSQSLELWKGEKFVALPGMKLDSVVVKTVTRTYID
jgi:hypothetical protein